MKKQMAIGIAGATAALIGGFKLVRQLVDRGDGTDGVAVAPGVPAEQAADTPTGDLSRQAEKNAGASGGGADSAPASAPAVSKKSSKAELYDVAQQLGIEGRSKMTKDELLKAIEAAG